MGKGINGVILKALRADDYRLTVTSVRQIGDKYLRLGFTGGGLLADHPVHPTQWIRIWFPDDDGDLQQRGYTLVDPDPGNDAFDIEFALHGGPASQWAARATVGDEIDATVMGSKFAVPEPVPSEFLIFGDSASLPAINSLLEAIDGAPARVFLEAGYDDDKGLPVARGADVTWVDRENDGEALVQKVKSAAFDAREHFGWVACDSRTTRSVKSVLQKDFGMPRKSIAARAYWMVGRSME